MQPWPLWLCKPWSRRSPLPPTLQGNSHPATVSMVMSRARNLARYAAHDAAIDCIVAHDRRPSIARSAGRVKPRLAALKRARRELGPPWLSSRLNRCCLPHEGWANAQTAEIEVCRLRRSIWSHVLWALPLDIGIPSSKDRGPTYRLAWLCLQWLAVRGQKLSPIQERRRGWLPRWTLCHECRPRRRSCRARISAPMPLAVIIGNDHRRSLSNLGDPLDLSPWKRHDRAPLGP